MYAALCHRSCQFSSPAATCLCTEMSAEYGHYTTDTRVRPLRLHNAMQIRHIYQCPAERRAGVSTVCRCRSSGVDNEERRMALLVTGDHRRTTGDLLTEQHPSGNDSPCDWRRTDVLHRVTDQQQQQQTHLTAPVSGHQLFPLSTDSSAQHQQPMTAISHWFRGRLQSWQKYWSQRSKFVFLQKENFNYEVQTRSICLWHNFHIKDRRTVWRSKVEVTYSTCYSNIIVINILFL